MTEQELKEKYKFDYIIDCEAEGKPTKTIYLKKPDLIILDAFGAQVATKPVLANKTLIESCIIREISDMEVLTDTDYFMSACTSLGEIITVKKSTLRKV